MVRLTKKSTQSCVPAKILFEKFHVDFSVSQGHMRLL